MNSKVFLWLFQSLYFLCASKKLFCRSGKVAVASSRSQSVRDSDLETSGTSTKVDPRIVIMSLIPPTPSFPTKTMFSRDYSKIEIIQSNFVLIQKFR